MGVSGHDMQTQSKLGDDMTRLVVVSNNETCDSSKVWGLRQDGCRKMEIETGVSVWIRASFDLGVPN